MVISPKQKLGSINITMNYHVDHLQIIFTRSTKGTKNRFFRSLFPIQLSYTLKQTLFNVLFYPLTNTNFYSRISKISLHFIISTPRNTGCYGPSHVLYYMITKNSQLACGYNHFMSFHELNELYYFYSLYVAVLRGACLCWFASRMS